ncbi:sulfurtransferase [Oryzomonas japonica]|uniref:Sulfurtransferase n=1 Tax=Oryzomonas japonica TaxID=2603858 RepID=A0A7J4ZMK0_9BACT|nr:rhodanese-like domain-containing protein [Oryzomonas japonica]KAB0663903.1 sulfurtransferase [Oryzomonas japonica]
MNTKPIRIIFTILALLNLTLASAFAGEAGYKGYPRGNALISVQELKRLIDVHNPKLVILAAENNVEYRLGHIPGSRQVDRPAIEAPPETQNGVTGNIIDAAGFSRLAQGLGIDQNSVVVVYDTKYDATRLWWAFTYYGKRDVRVLDGGVKAWRAAGYPVDILAPDARARRGGFAARIAEPRLRVDTPEINAKRGSATAQLWDNRDLKEFTGEELKKGAYRAGRIPGSNHSNWALFKKKDNQAEWLNAAELEHLLHTLGYDRNKEQYFYCQSGVRSTQALFALYLAGWPLEKLHNYDSSWIGWSKDTALPLAQGAPQGARLAEAR